MSAEDEATGLDFPGRCCPVCGGGKHVRAVSSHPKAETAAWKDIAQCWAGFFKTRLFFTYARCTGCGVLYCPRYFSEAQIARLYASMADNTAGLGAERMSRTQAGYVALLGGESTTGDFLELGPDIGLFAAAYARRFDPESRRRYWLFEPNVAVHGELRRHLSGLSIELRTQLSELAEVPDGSLGTVVMIHVLDHLLEPKAVLGTLRRKLRPGAMLHVVTHNEGSLLAWALRERWPAFCLQHPQLFRPRTIFRLMEESGFAVESVQRTKNYFPAAYLLRHGLFALGIDLPVLSRFNGMEVGFKHGNILTSAWVKQ